MKRQLFIISIIVVIVSIFVSCSVNSGGDVSDGASTIPTEKGTQPSADNSYDEDNSIDFVPDEANNKNSSTTDGTSHISTENSSTDNMTGNSGDARKTDGASPIPTEKETTTTSKEIQPATDKDGWITKWY